MKIRTVKGVEEIKEYYLKEANRLLERNLTQLEIDLDKLRKEVLNKLIIDNKVFD